MKKILVLLLALAMLAGVFSACGPAETEDKLDSDTVETAAPEETVDQNYVPEFPDVFYGNDSETDFNILCENVFWGTTDQFFVEEDSDDPVVSAVYNRMLVIKEQFGVDITVAGSANTTSDLRSNENSGAADYDAIVGRMPLIASSAAEGLLTDLYDVETLNLKKHYWDQYANGQLSMGGKLYYTIGDIITTDDNATWTMMFNKKLAANYDLEDLYQVVREGRWTFDYFYKVITETNASFDVNGDGERNHLDSYAFATHMDMGYGFFYAAGLSFVSKDGNDIPVLTTSSNSEKILDVLEYSVKVMRENNLTLDAHKWVHINPQAHILIADAFKEDRALFFSEVLSTIIGFREMDTDFGIIPLPKYNEQQANYTTFVNPAASLVGIPKSMYEKDGGERSGVILEALAYYGYKMISPAYYDKAIEGQSTRDYESLEMLEIILKNRTYDLGLVNQWGDIPGAYNQLVFQGKTDYASMIGKNAKKAEKALAKFLDKLGLD